MSREKGGPTVGKGNRGCFGIVWLGLPTTWPARQFLINLPMPSPMHSQKNSAHSVSRVLHTLKCPWNEVAWTIVTSLLLLSLGATNWWRSHVPLSGVTWVGLQRLYKTPSLMYKHVLSFSLKLSAAMNVGVPFFVTLLTSCSLFPLSLEKSSLAILRKR